MKNKQNRNKKWIKCLKVNESGSKTPKISYLKLDKIGFKSSLIDWVTLWVFMVLKETSVACFYFKSRFFKPKRAILLHLLPDMRQRNAPIQHFYSCTLKPESRESLENVCENCTTSRGWLGGVCASEKMEDTRRRKSIISRFSSGCICPREWNKIAFPVQLKVVRY